MSPDELEPIEGCNVIWISRDEALTIYPIRNFTISDKAINTNPVIDKRPHYRKIEKKSKREQYLRE